MSEQSWPVKVQIPPMFRPEMMVGAACPLWGYFAGAAIAGSAWWWMTRWMQPANLEAMAEAAFEPAVEALAEAIGGPVAEALMNDKGPAFPVGGESAPFSTVVLEAELISDPSLAADLAQAPEPALPPELTPASKPVLVAEPAPIPEPTPIPGPVLAAEPAIEPTPAPPPTAKRKSREAEANKPH